MLGALAARRGRQQPAVGDRAEAHLRERAVRVGGGVDVAQRLVGDEQVPRDRLQVGRVAVEQAVGGEHDAGALAERAVERADLPGDRAVLGRARARRRWAPAAAGRGRARRRSARRATGRAAGPRRRRARGSAASTAARWASARPVVTSLAGADLAGVDAGADDLQRRDLLLAAEQDRVVGERPGAGHAHDLAGAGVERDARARALERAQLGDRLLGDDAARGGADAVGAW